MPNKNRDSMQGYHNFKDDNGEIYGSFEVLWLDKRFEETPYDKYDKKHAPSGWYWVAGFPGCLWDGDPAGPFSTSNQAYNNAMEF